MRSALMAAVVLSAATAAAQQDFSKVEIKPTKLADGIYMLTGAGGNIGLSVGDDAVFLVDDQFAPLTQKIKAAIAAITRQAGPLRAQHALARRPHRRQREPRQGRRRSSSRTTTCASG